MRFLLLFLLLPASLAAQTPDWTAIDAAMGRPAAVQPGGLHRYSFPRSDLRVSVGAVPVRPALALGGWVVFAPHGAAVVAMGDLVLTADEVAPVVGMLQKGGVEQTAIHHHLVGESPRVYYVHIHAHGEPLALARAIRTAVASTAIPAPAPGLSADPAPFSLDTAAIARTLGASGRVSGGVYQVSIPRMETIREGDFEIPAAMGLGTVINFQPTGEGKAAVTGDFVLTAGEVNTVIRILGEQRIQPTSLHNHLLTEEPRLFFLHFWGHDDALQLARGLAAALDRTRSKRFTQ